MKNSVKDQLDKLAATKFKPLAKSAQRIKELQANKWKRPPASPPSP